MQPLRFVITRKPLQLGFMYVPKESAKLFPSTNVPVKLVALFNEDSGEFELTYNPKYRRIHGLSAFYREHNAQIGDLVKIEVLQNLKKYKFKFEKASASVDSTKLTTKKTDIFPLVGAPINFRGLMYAPIHENGVIFLFSKVAEDLGITIEGIQVKFPDAFGKQYNKEKGHPITIEFEYKSSDYERHGHPKEACDLIVCWEHDWKECPISVIELKTLIQKLPTK